MPSRRSPTLRRSSCGEICESAPQLFTAAQGTAMRTSLGFGACLARTTFLCEKDGFGLSSTCARPDRGKRNVVACASKLGHDVARPGWTYLVGSGPGGLDHLTHRAGRLVATADIIVADSLADEEVLNLRRADSDLWRVGKRGGDPQSVPQAEISALLQRLQRDARPSVVRLKAGDPCLFGRASEELQALAASELPHLIVPGVSSVSAAAAALGVSLTDKHLNRNVVAISGHDPDALNYEALAGLDSIAVLMAGQHFELILKRLREAAGGESCRREVSIVRWALRNDVQSIIVASIHDIAARVREELPEGLSPSVVLIRRVEDEEN